MVVIRGLALGLFAVFVSFALAKLTPRPVVVAPPPAPHSAPQTLSFGATPAATHEIPALDHLAPEARQRALLALEQTRAPCSPCWERGSSIAACLELAVCPNLAGLLQRTRRLAGAGYEADALLQAISYGDIWVPEAAGPATGPVQVELWIDPGAPFAADAFTLATRISELPSAPVVTVYLFRSNSTGAAARGRSRSNVDFQPQATARVAIVPQRASTAEMATARGVRSSPTWFVHGYRMRGMQSTDAIALVLRREIDDRQGAAP